MSKDTSSILADITTALQRALPPPTVTAVDDPPQPERSSFSFPTQRARESSVDSGAGRRAVALQRDDGLMSAIEGLLTSSQHMVRARSRTSPLKARPPASAPQRAPDTAARDAGRAMQPQALFRTPARGGDGFPVPLPRPPPRQAPGTPPRAAPPSPRPPASAIYTPGFRAGDRSDANASHSSVSVLPYRQIYTPGYKVREAARGSPGPVPRPRPVVHSPARLPLLEQVLDPGYVAVGDAARSTMRGNAVLPGSPGRDGQFASRWTAAVRVFDTFNRMDIEAEEGLRKRMAVTVAQVFNPVLSKLEEGVKRLQERHAQLVQSPRPLALDNTSRLSSPAQAGPGPSAAERSGVSDVSRSSRAVRSLGPSFSQNASPVVAAQTTAGARSGTLHDSVLSGGTRVVPSGGVTGNLQASIPVVVMTQDQASQLSITA